MAADDLAGGGARQSSSALPSREDFIMFLKDWKSHFWSRVLLRSLAFPVCLLLLPPSHDSEAQAASEITASSGALDLNTTAPGVCSGTCTITGGTASGPNLYHSFGIFDVGGGDTAFFNTADSTPNPGVGNILGRVTGGDPSSIFGAIDTATRFPNANFFLMNPAGIVFGPGAGLNVGGSVAFTTAHKMNFTSGGPFAMNTTDVAALSVPDVASFGFLPGTTVGGFAPLPDTPTAILVQADDLVVTPDETITFVGGNGTFANPSGGTVSAGVTLEGGTVLARGGRIQIASLGTVTDDTEVAIDAPNPGVAITNEVSLGNITIQGGAKLDVSAKLGVAPTVVGPPPPFIPGIGFCPCVIAPGSPAEGTDGIGGKVIIRAGHLMINGASTEVTTKTVGTVANPSVGIDFQAKKFELTNGAKVESTVSGVIAGVPDAEGKIPVGGKILVDVQDLKVRGGAQILTLTESSSAAPEIEVKVAKALTLDGFGPDGILSGIKSRSEGTAAASGPLGSITVTAGSGTIINGARIGSEGLSSGTSLTQFGPITVTVTDTLRISGRRPATQFPSSILSFSTGESKPSNISVSAGTVILEQGGLIGSRSVDVGEGGDTINVTGQEAITISGGGGISSIAFKEAIGDVTVSTPALTLADEGFISTSTTDIGDAGDIFANVGAATLRNGAEMNSSSKGGAATGQAGNITIQGFGGAGTKADSVVLRSGSAITTEADQASGGNISIFASDILRSTDSKITTSVFGPSGTSGGDIFIDPRFVILKNSSIIAQATQGRGGNITIIATRAFLADPNSTVSASAGDPSLSGSVDIQSPVQQLSGTVAPLPGTTLEAAALLRAACAAELQGQQASSFVQAGRDSMPASPGDMLASPLLLPSQARRTASVTEARSDGSSVTGQDDMEEGEASRGMPHLGALTRLVLSGDATVCRL